MSNKFDDISSKARNLATQVGEGLRDKVPGKAMQWIETGAALGVVKTGGRAAVTLVRRNPLIAAAAAAGAGLLWYAAKRRADQTRQGPIEGSATRIDARRVDQGAPGSDDPATTPPQRTRRTSANRRSGARPRS